MVQNSTSYLRAAWIRIRHAWSSYAIAAIVFLALFVLNWFVVEKYFPAPSAAVERATAVIGSQAYQSKAREKVAVLELNDAYLEWLEMTWPPSYALYQSMLEDIAQYRPRSIFLDIALVHSRSDSGIQALIDTMCRIADDDGIPIYLAAMKDADKGLYLRSELMDAAKRRAMQSPQAPPCFHLVSVTYSPDEGTHLATTYPLHNPYPSAAFAIASEVWLQDCVSEKRSTTGSAASPDHVAHCQAELAAKPMPQSMSLTWAMWGHDTSKSYQQWKQCEHKPHYLWELLPQPLRKAWYSPEALPMPCPFHDHVPLRMIADPHSDAEFNMLRSSLEGRHVMIGAVVRGINDMVNAPIQGYIPGVYLHAMALDNLLTDYPYIKSGDAPQEAMPLGGWVLAAVVAWVCFLMHEVGRVLFQVDAPVGGEKHKSGAHKDKDAPSSQPSTWPGRAWQEAWRLFRWVGFKVTEIVSSLFLSGLVFAVFLKFDYSIQTLAQVMTVVFGLQWTGITNNVYESVCRIFFGDTTSHVEEKIHAHSPT